MLERSFGAAAVAADMSRLYRAAEQAGYALGCIDVEDPDDFLSGKPTALTHIQFWFSVAGLSALFLMM